IVNGDSPPPKRTIDGVEKTYPPTTAEEKLARKNKLKVRGTLLMALPNEHQLKFNTYKCAKTLMEALEKSLEGLDKTYARLQKLISQLEILDETISQEDMNLKFLSSLPSEWKTHTLISRNKPDLDTLSMDDLYNNLNIYETKIDAGDLEEMDQKWQMAMLTMRAKRFLNKTGRKINANGSETIGFNKSKAEEGPTNFALMEYTSLGSSSSSSLDSDVSTYLKASLKSYETIKEHYDNLTKDFNKSHLKIGAYKASLESVEARLDVYKKNEVVFEEDIKILKLDIKLRDNALTELRKKFEKAEKERDYLKLTLEKFENSSKNLSKLLEIQVIDKFKTGVGYDSQVVYSLVNDKHKTGEGYHVVPPLYTGNFMPPKPNLVLANEEEYVFTSN
ncbi:hypothetical protein Tco_1084038, partial [Tanacetum coccineum]